VYANDGFWCKLNELRCDLQQNVRLWTIQRKLALEGGTYIVAQAKPREEVIQLIEELMVQFLQKAMNGVPSFDVPCRKSKPSSFTYGVGFQMKHYSTGRQEKKRKQGKDQMSQNIFW
jgi:hypothetical protein